MADTYSQPAERPATARAIRLWVLGLLATAGLMLFAGLLLAKLVEGPARPWAGLGLLMGAGLAAIVGVSKTSSA
jgi:hypothetical protein